MTRFIELNHVYIGNGDNLENKPVWVNIDQIAFYSQEQFFEETVTSINMLRAEFLVKETPEEIDKLIRGY